MDDRLQKLESEIEEIKERNFRVEGDKAWEVSWTRSLFIACSTYVIAAVWLLIIKDSLPWLKAIVPAVGYLLSVQSLPFIKRWWLKNRKDS